MRQIFIALFAALWATAAASFEGDLDTPFDARVLNSEEKRFLQAALAYEGHYKARLDGAWGQGSQTALQRAIRERFDIFRPTWETTAILARDFSRKMRDDGWEVVEDKRSGMSVLLPRGRMEPISGVDYFGLRTTDDALRFRAFTTDGRRADAIHGQIRGRLQDRRNAYMVSRDRLMVTAGNLYDGTETYARSDANDNRWATGLIEWRPERKGDAGLAIASLRLGPQTKPTAPAGALRRAIKAQTAREEGSDTGTAAAQVQQQPERIEVDSAEDAFALLMGILAQRAGRSEPEVEAEPEIEADSPLLPAGLGFYVNNTDLVVPASLQHGCDGRGLALADGTPLEKLSDREPLGLNFVTSAARSTAWIAIPDATSIAAGKAMTAYELERKGWNDGRIVPISAQVLGELPRDGAGRNVAVSLPARKRSLGAPIFDEGGQLAGIALGSVPIPENADKAERKAMRKISRVVPTGLLGNVLARNGILYQSAASKPEAATEAVRAIYCR